MATENVFVVEHDPTSRAALCQCLTASGFTVRAFSSAESILEYRPPKGPACVVLDYDLPGVSGLELQRKLLDESPLSIVFVTSRADVSAVVKAMKGGAVDFLTRPVALWLERQLDFPNWTPESIAQMPETHIAEWARSNEVPMDKLYATEEREGGTRAVGDNVPGFQRGQLSVLTPDEWERAKRDLVFESWVQRAAAAKE